VVDVSYCVKVVVVSPHRQIFGFFLRSCQRIPGGLILHVVQATSLIARWRMLNATISSMRQFMSTR
jgi:hypothetical protein